jgi:hypothetical protein
MDSTQATARFYFNLTYQLAKEDITKIEQVENMSLYMALNVASLMKDQYERERDEQNKLNQQMNKR